MDIGKYEYNLIKREMKNLKTKVANFSIGKSEMGEDITCFKLGNNDKKSIIVQGSIHAREYITGLLIIKEIKFLQSFILDCTIYFIPFMNPDGVKISLLGRNFTKNKKLQNKLININSGENFSLYKANVKGVDLNKNFDADWGKSIYCLEKPSSQDYPGEFVLSENESKALTNFTNSIKPILTISYHSKGEVVYYGYNGQTHKEKRIQRSLLNIIKADTNYKPLKSAGSTGGYKDYCVKQFKIPAFTIEVGNDGISHPIRSYNLKSIFDKNKWLLLDIFKKLV